LDRPSSHILELARRGAHHRLREIVGEAKLLLTTFPNLRDSFDPDELPIDFIVAKGARRRPQATSSKASRRRARAAGQAADSSRSDRRPPNWSAAARKAVSERMKKYWAARRKAKT
jgi:hypothetical protein